MRFFRRNEDGAAMPMAVALAFLLTFSIAVLSVFVLAGVEHEQYAVKQNQAATGQDAALSEALGKINAVGGVTGTPRYEGTTYNTKTTDGMYEWYVRNNAGKYDVVMRLTAESGIGELEAREANKVVRPLVSKPVSNVYPALNASVNTGDPAMLYEPVTTGGMFGYFQSSFHGFRLGDVDDATKKSLMYTMGPYVQNLTDVKMLSYNSASTPSPGSSTGKGTWTTSLNFADPSIVDPNENTSLVVADRENFSGVNKTVIGSNVANPRPASECSGCSTGERKYYSYDMSYDEVENIANTRCGSATGTWRASSYSGVLDPNLNSGCWDTMIFDRNTSVVANTDRVVYAKNIIIEQTVRVNSGQSPSNLRLVNFGTGGFKMSHGSTVNGLVMSFGQKSCDVNGVGGLPAKVYGSLVCANGFDVNRAELWWDTTLESKYLATPSTNKMWEYGN